MKKLLLLALIVFGGVMNVNADNKLKGEWDGWTEHMVTFDGSIGSVTIENLAANHDYEFGLLDGSAFYKNNGTMTIDNCSNWAFSTSDNNAKIRTTIAGNYTFKVVWISGAPHIWVVYPDQGQYVVHFNNYDSWGSINCHLYLQGTDVKGNTWPGVSVTTTNANNDDYYDFTLNDHFYDGIIFSKGGENQSSNLTISYNSAREFWVTNSNTLTYNAPSGWIGHKRNVTSGNWGTVCLPFAATVTGADVYKVVSTVGEGDGITGINLETVASLEAGKPYIFQATGSELVATYSGSYTAASAAFGMMGNLSSTSVKVAEGNYVVSGNKVKKVVSGGSGVTCGQYRAYITLDGISPAAARGAHFIGFDDETTGIESIQAEENQNEVYNLQGQRVMNGQKGLFIVNGKKVIRK